MKSVQSPCAQLPGRLWSALPASDCQLWPSEFSPHCGMALARQIMDQAERAAAVHRTIDPETVLELLYG